MDEAALYTIYFRFDAKTLNSISSSYIDQSRPSHPSSVFGKRVNLSTAAATSHTLYWPLAYTGIAHIFTQNCAFSSYVVYFALLVHIYISSFSDVNESVFQLKLT